MSASDELQPRLTRIVDPARSAPTPIAASTWLGPTLPEEQAAPALTMTPSRSSAMTWVSAGVPGHAVAGAFGKRCAGAPHTPPAGASAGQLGRQSPPHARDAVVARDRATGSR